MSRGAHIEFREIHCSANFVRSFTAIEGSFLTDRTLRRCVSKEADLVSNGIIAVLLFIFQRDNVSKGQRKGTNVFLCRFFFYQKISSTDHRKFFGKVKLNTRHMMFSRTLFEETITFTNLKMT